MTMKINLEEIEIKIKLSEKPNLRATAVISFGDITVKGFRISVSEHENENMQGEKIYLQPPSYRAGRGYQKLVFINDKDKWIEIEKLVFKEYQKVKDDENLWVD